jgi:hypothetical protein
MLAYNRILKSFKFICLSLFLVFIGCKIKTKQSVKRDVNESTLVIIDNKQIFTNDSKKYTDTLSEKYFYEVLTTKEEVRRYTGLKTIKKVIVINH